MKRVTEHAAFDTHAECYDVLCARGLKLSGESRAYFARGRVDYLKKWWQITGRVDPSVILDFGCGTGETTALLAESFPHARVYGLDVSRESIERATRAFASDRIRFHIPGSEHDPLPSAALVHVNGVIHHVLPAQREQVFASIRKTLGERGVLAMFENNPLNPGTQLVMSRIPFDRDAVPVPPWEARRRIGACGLRIVHHGYLFYFPRALRLLRFLEPWLVRLPLGAQYGIFAVRE